MVPFAFSEELVRNSGLPSEALIDVAGDHWLSDTELLEMMLEAVETTQSTDAGNGCYDQPMTEPIDPDNLRPGPIRHESLPPELLEAIGAVYQLIGPYLDTTLEQFETGFMRDAHPENEVGIWCHIAATWLVYHEKHLDDNLLAEEDEKTLLSAVIAISSGVEDVEALGVPVDVGRKLLSYYESFQNE